MHPRATAVLEYWQGIPVDNTDLQAYNSAQKSMWWGGGPKVDEEIMNMFTEDIEAVAKGQYDMWQTSSIAQETVAGIILMDQFTRNVYRGLAKQYDLDSKARAWVQSILENGAALKQLRYCDRVWVYLPLMHSEELKDQQECVRLFQVLVADARAAGNEELAAAFEFNVKYAVAHEAVIAKWGRFPHRNAVLGRSSTPEEEAGLADGSIAKF